MGPPSEVWTIENAGNAAVKLESPQGTIVGCNPSRNRSVLGRPSDITHVPRREDNQ
jgi:hypothetical protein